MITGVSENVDLFLDCSINWLTNCSILIKHPSHRQFVPFYITLLHVYPLKKYTQILCKYVFKQWIISEAQKLEKHLEFIFCSFKYTSYF